MLWHSHGHYSRSRNGTVAVPKPPAPRHLKRHKSMIPSCAADRLHRNTSCAGRSWHFPAVPATLQLFVSWRPFDATWYRRAAADGAVTSGCSQGDLEDPRRSPAVDLKKAVDTLEEELKASH